jgi:hypothetical protein
LVVSGQTCLGVNAYRDLTYWDDADFHPQVTTEQMLGTWRFRNEWVTLSADGTFIANDGFRGTWSVDRNDFRSEASPRPEWGWAVVAIRDRGKLVLLRPKEEDPDLWQRGDAFVKEGQ